MQLSLWSPAPTREIIRCYHLARPPAYRLFVARDLASLGHLTEELGEGANETGRFWTEGSGNQRKGVRYRSPRLLLLISRRCYLTDHDEWPEGHASAFCSHSPRRKPIDWRLTENRAMLLCNERSFQAHCLAGCRSVSVAGSARGRDFNVAATDRCSATNRPQETNLRCHRPIGVRWSLSPLPSRS